MISFKELAELPEYGDFDVFFTLKGWVPERLPVHEDENSKLWSHVKSLNLKSYTIGPSRSSPSRDNRTSTTPATLRGGSSLQTTPYMIILAYRDAPESNEEESNLGLKTMRYSFRVCDYRESADSSTLNDDDNGLRMSAQKYIRVRGYFSCG